MPARLGLVALIGILAAVGLTAGYTFRHGQVQTTPVAPPAPAAPLGAGAGAGAGAGGGPHGPGGAGQGAGGVQKTQQPSITTSAIATSTATSPAMGPGMGPRQGHGGPGAGAGGSGMGQIDSRIQAACISAGINNQPIGMNIRWLFDNHDMFRYQLMEFPENRTIVWIITAPDKAALETLVSHVMQMECAVENGGTPRPFDPLFQVDAAISSKYVHVDIQWLNDTAVKIVKVADNDCAYEVIKLHAQVVKGFFDTGRLEAQKTHEVPPEALEICKPYLEGEGS